MTDVSTEIFQTFSISMGMQKIEDELRDLRKKVIGKDFNFFLCDIVYFQLVSHLAIQAMS